MQVVSMCTTCRLLAYHIHALSLRLPLLTGAEGVGAILERVPQLLLCKPTLMDRWDRRVAFCNALVTAC